MLLQSAILTPLFRYLLLIYLAGSAILVAALVHWQHFQADERKRWHLQQYADLLKVSLKPYLQLSSAEQLSSHLTDLQYSALLPVAALGIYHADGAQLARAGTNPLLPKELPKPLQRQYQLYHTDSDLFAVQPLFTKQLAVEQLASYQVPDAYLVIVPEVADTWCDDWQTVMLAWGIFSLAFLLFVAGLYRWQQQINQWLSSLKRQFEETTSASDTTATPPEAPTALAELQWLFSALAECQKNQREQNQTLHQQLTQLQRELAESKVAQQLWQQQSGREQQQVHAWLHQYKLVWQRQEQLSAPVFQALLRLHFLYGLLQFAAPAINKVPLTLNSWLAQQLPQLNNLLPHAVSIDWIEGADNTDFVVLLDENVLQAVLQALLLLALRSDNANRIMLRVAIEKAPEPILHIHLSCDGSGLPAHLINQLQQGNNAQWQWRDADIAVLQLYTKIVAADFAVQSLEGLGSSMRFTLPVQLQATNFSAGIGHLLVFDVDAERLNERLVSLSSQAIQVSGCHTLAQLQQKLSTAKADMLLLFAPPQAPDQDWLMLLNRCRQQLAMQVWAPTLNLAAWQAVISCKAAPEFCLNALLHNVLPALPVITSKNLLVVDDNETNQAFIRVLLQHKAVCLQAAFTGQEVLQLCQQQQFDMILLDIRLPDLSGIEVARRLRQLPSYRDTPILAFTAHALPAEIAEFKQAGMNDILLKPLEPCQFEMLLARYQLY